MVWIKLTHVSGSTYINLEQVYRFEETSSTDITIYDANSILPVTYSFASATALKAFISKIESVSKVIDIDRLAQQQG